MAQKFKSVYLADHPAAEPSQRHLKLAFGAHDTALFEAVRMLSGQELREALGFGSYERLRAAAEADGATLNAFCLKVLREHLGNGHGYRVGTNGLGLTPLQATYKGGASEPLHRWYPLLEGYSPQYVEAILERYAPGAGSVFDPFSGTGTTPITASRLGRAAWYAEINPLLQLLSAIKARVLASPAKRRLGLAAELERLAEHLPRRLAESDPAADLAQSYPATFGRSLFFDAETFERVLRARELLDELACRDPFLAALAGMAVLASLVPSSLLTRAGDLRYKTPEELTRERVDFTAAARAQLALMAADLRRLGDAPLSGQPVLVAEDARALGKLPPLEVAAVVTSPPYLNGTNYFRNTKLELWFLRCLRSRQDLAAFRSRAITAGINDVSRRRELREAPEAVRAIVEHLARDAYDQRIPRMVHSYFQDMAAVFDALGPHLREGAVVAIDIGDSAYGGVHVPTDRLLAELLEQRGLRLEDEVPLRRRLSRGGHVLRQVLLVFRRAGESASGRAGEGLGAGERGSGGAGEGWRPRWESFKKTMPHQQPPYSRRNWGHPLHSLCSFQGKMKPALAAHLVETFVPAGGTVLDPFAGVATIPFEAALSGRRAFGFELSPAAVPIGAAKLGRAEREGCERTLQGLEGALLDAGTRGRGDAGSWGAGERASGRFRSGGVGEGVSAQEWEEAQALGFNGRIADYFHPETLREVLVARRYFLEHPPGTASEALVLAGLLHILHGNRPYALSRRSHPITPFAPSGPFEYRALLPRLREKVERSLAAALPPAFTEGEMLFQDATAWWPPHVQDLDAVVTSPPFFDSTRFYLANWMRLWFAGWSAGDFQARPRLFVDERQKQDFATYRAIFRQARERLKPGGVLVLHLGKSRKCDMAEQLARVAEPWFRVADRFSESVAHCESHGISDKGTVEAHQYLVLR